MKSLSGDQKQKLFILLGFVGFLVVAGYFALSPKGEDDAATQPLTATAQTVPSVPAAPARATPQTSSQPTATPAKVVKVAVPVIPAPARAALAPHRSDPFAPKFYPTPAPPVSPTPIPPPIVIPAPDGVQLPSPAPVGAPPSTVLVGLPSPRISRYSPLPGPRWAVTSSSAGNAPTGRSTNKRLSGVIIGDSVRALLEIEVEGGGEGGEGGGAGGAQVITRVVQPGDEVDGIRILRINREFENGRPVTRMYIREGDQERYVDLRPSPSPPTGAGEGFEGGSSMGSGRGSFGSGSPSSGGSSSGFGGIRPVFPGR